MGVGKDKVEQKRSKREMAKAAGRKVLDRVLDPRIDEVVSKIDKILQWVFFCLYLLVAIGIIPFIMGVFIIIFVLLEWLFGLPFNLLTAVVIFFFLEAGALGGYFLIKREIREEIEEHLYVDNFIVSLFTGTIGMIKKITLGIAAGLILIGGIAVIVLVVQFGLWKVGISVALIVLFLELVGLAIIIVMSLLVFVLKFIVGKAITKILSKIPFQAARSAALYTKMGEDEAKKLEKKGGGKKRQAKDK